MRPLQPAAVSDSGMKVNPVAVALWLPVAVMPCLYEWKAVFESGSIFGDSIPLSEEGQKTILYQFVKDYLGLHDYCDVIE